jgi:hypothetical protein
MTQPYTHATVSVGPTATLIASMPTAAQAVGGVLVKNNGRDTVHLGGPTVTADTLSTGGFQLASGQSVVMPVAYQSAYDLYGITAAGTSSVTYLGPSRRARARV